jgi:hypothetical protein
MIEKSRIAIFVMCLIWFGAEFTSGGLAAAEGDRSGYRAQAFEGSVRAGQRSPAEVSPLPQGKPRPEPGKEEKPAAPSKSESPKPFEPTEKVKADQALDFPADI